MAWHRLGLLPAAMAAVLHGCGGRSSGVGVPNDSAGDATASPWRSGSRLRARIRDGGDGARLFEGWWDRQLGMPCAFHEASDHKIRCLPELQLTPDYPADDCSTPAIAIVPTETPAGVYFSFTMLPSPPKDPPPDCLTRTCWRLPTANSVGLLGDLVSVSRVWSVVLGCACSSLDVIPSTMSRSFTVVSPEMFVSASERSVGDPIAAR